MTPKEFIKQVFVDELGQIKDSHAYISFAIMAIGIEFLGKCLDDKATDWNVSGKSKRNFNGAINKLKALSRYRPYLKKYELWNSLRNGFAHSFVPKYPVSLSSKNEAPHLLLYGNGLNLKCEDFYEDFKNACLEVIDMEFPDKNNKINKEILFVPQECNKIFSNHISDSSHFHI